MATTHITLIVTDETGNRPAGWLPAPFVTRSVTTSDEHRDEGTEQAAWAELAAQARAAWAADNRF